MSVTSFFIPVSLTDFKLVYGSYLLDKFVSLDKSSITCSTLDFLTTSFQLLKIVPFFNLINNPRSCNALSKVSLGNA